MKIKTVYNYKNSVLEELQSRTNVPMPNLIHYYDIKYPYLNYPFCTVDGEKWIMYSIPMVGLVQLYRRYVGGRPYSFFDCGCATGELVRQAEEMGICATGIDVKQYGMDERCKRFFDSGRIQMRSILDYDIVDADLAYCNGTLTYMTRDTLPLALEKFKRVKMLVAIHNTTEDMRAADKMGWKLLHGEPRLIRGRRWWLETFRQNGFDVKYDAEYRCFCAIPNSKTR
ncbi:MAG: hypothetical protein NC311_02370 [Muribaculaceae bacterium]|nr:hypothetical protein [Muribaculaceae bacterium]